MAILTFKPLYGWLSAQIVTLERTDVPTLIVIRCLLYLFCHLADNTYDIRKAPPLRKGFASS